MVCEDLGRFVNFPGPGRPPSQHRDENGRDSFQVMQEVALGLPQSYDPVYRAQEARLLLAMKKLRSKDVPEDQPTLTPLTERVILDYVVRNILKNPKEDRALRVRRTQAELLKLQLVLI